MKLIKYITIVGNVGYTLLIMQNGISQGLRNFGGFDTVFFIGLVILLIFNLAILTKIEL